MTQPDLEQCARDEITEWVASFYAGDDLAGAVEWLLAWANRRAAQVQAHIVAALRDVAGLRTAIEQCTTCTIDTAQAWAADEDTIAAARLHARQALRWAALPVDVPLQKGGGGE